MMVDGRAVVQHLLDRLTAGEADRDPRAVVDRLFTPDATYLVGPGFPPVVGAEALAAEFTRQAQTFADLAITVQTWAVDGRTVVTERVDEFTLVHNGVRATNPLVAVFELTDDGRIAAWREYWDMQSLGALIAQPAASA
jgi:uncharacterized protein (TIGR02246 family)